MLMLFEYRYKNAFAGRRWLVGAAVEFWFLPQKRCSDNNAVALINFIYLQKRSVVRKWQALVVSSVHIAPFKVATEGVCGSTWKLQLGRFLSRMHSHRLYWARRLRRMNTTRGCCGRTNRAVECGIFLPPLHCRLLKKKSTFGRNGRLHGGTAVQIRNAPGKLTPSFRTSTTRRMPTIRLSHNLGQSPSNDSERVPMSRTVMRTYICTLPNWT